MADLYDIAFARNMSGGGGTSDYGDLTNKPQINGVPLSGNKTGADLGLVPAENGKGLSTEDYTTAEKTKLAGIEPEANKTVVDTEINNTSTNPVENKAVYEALSGKVDKVNGKQLSTEDYTTAEKTALAGQVTKTAGIDSTANSYIEMGNGLRLYISSTEPTDSDIPDGSVWVGGVST